MTNSKTVKKPEMKTYVKKLSATQIEKFNKAKAKENSHKVTVPLDDEHQLEFNIKRFITTEERIALMNDVVKLCFQRDEDEVYDTYYPCLLDIALPYCIAQYYTDIKLDGFDINTFYDFANNIGFFEIINDYVNGGYASIGHDAVTACAVHNKELRAKKKAFHMKNEIIHLVDYAIGALAGFQDGKEYLDELTSTEEGKAAVEEFVQNIMNGGNPAEVTE